MQHHPCISPDHNDLAYAAVTESNHLKNIRSTSASKDDPAISIFSNCTAANSIMAILSNLKFSNGNDVYSDSGFGLFQGTVETQGGDDVLVATTPAGTSFAQTFIIQDAQLKTGDGNDIVKGDGSAGFQCNGILLAAFSASGLTGIDTGNGNDIVIGLGSTGGFGIANFSAQLSTGSGNDIIVGRSATSSLGIYNFGLIDTGSGNDQMIASGLINGGTINMGTGNDLINVEDGFGAGGDIRLGDGNDIARGLQSGKLDGGAGFDIALLKQGVYNISQSGSSFEVAGLLSMTSIEAIGSLQGVIVPLRAGVLNIADNGSIFYG